MNDVLFIYDDAMLDHRPGPGHPERPARLDAIRERLRSEPVEGASWRSPGPAPRSAIERIHAAAYIDRLEALRGQRARLDPDTAISGGSVEAAWLAAGASIEAVRAVTTGDAGSAFALVRPPGHHAEAERSMGFCLFNNIAIAAAYARAEIGYERLLIIDWDVHHGNGTQHAFEGRRDILVFNTHRYPFYPGTGAADEVGTGNGEGFTVNVPFPSGRSNGDYAAAFRELLVPIATAYEPDLVLVSAGFDAHTSDPLGGMKVTTGGFASLCRTALQLADKLAEGHLALILEGGYNPRGLADCALACAGVLTGDKPSEPSDAGRTGRDVIEKVRRIQADYWPSITS